MRALVVLAVIATSMPALAAMSQEGESAKAPRDRKVCTRIQQRGASRLPSRRVCLTEAEWRQRLGADWRLALRGGAGRSVEDDTNRLSVITRPTTGVAGQGPET